VKQCDCSVKNRLRTKQLHKRLPHVRDDNTSTIAWINNYHRSLKEYHREGFCQRCGKPFKPGDINYAHFASIPTGRGGIVN